MFYASRVAVFYRLFCSRRWQAPFVPALFALFALTVADPPAAVASCSPDASAAEQDHGEGISDQRIAELRRRDRLDELSEELAQALDGKNLSAPRRAILQLEQGKTLETLALRQPAGAERVRLQKRAVELLSEFTRKQPRHARLLEAQKSLAQVQVQQAGGFAKQAAEAPSERRPLLLKKTRITFEQARKTLAVWQRGLTAKLRAMPAFIDRKQNPKQWRQRTVLRADLLQAQLQSAASLEYLADTWPDDSQQRQEKLTAAAKDFAGLYERYRTRLAGLYALLYQGRCLHKLGRPRDALEKFDDLREQPSSIPALRTLQSEAVLLAVPCWLDAKVKRPRVAVRVTEAWLAQIRDWPDQKKYVARLEARLQEARAALPD